MSRPRRIVHLIDKLDGYGLARQLQLLAESQASRGDVVEIISFAAEQHFCRQLASQGLQCRVLHRRWKLDLLVVLRLSRQLRYASADFWHTWGNAVLPYAGAALSRHRNPRIATLEDPDIPEASVRLFDSLAIHQPNLRAATKSPRQAKFIVPGVKHQQTGHYSRQLLLQELRLPGDSLLILNTTPLTRENQLDEAIWCFELVRTLQPQARLLLFGNSSDRNRLQRFARSACEPGSVCFVEERFDRRKVLPVIDVAWQFAPHDTYWQEMLEPMGLGIPVVASDIPLHREMMIPHETGSLAPPQNRAVWARKTLELLEDRALAERIGNASRNYIRENYSLEQFLAAYDRLYAEV